MCGTKLSWMWRLRRQMAAVCQLEMWPATGWQFEACVIFEDVVKTKRDKNSSWHPIDPVKDCAGAGSDPKNFNLLYINLPHFSGMETLLRGSPPCRCSRGYVFTEISLHLGNFSVLAKCSEPSYTGEAEVLPCKAHLQVWRCDVDVAMVVVVALGMSCGSKLGTLQNSGWFIIGPILVQYGYNSNVHNVQRTNIGPIWVHCLHCLQGYQLRGCVDTRCSPAEDLEGYVITEVGGTSPGILFETHRLDMFFFFWDVFLHVFTCFLHGNPSFKPHFLSGDGLWGPFPVNSMDHLHGMAHS